MLLFILEFHLFICIVYGLLPTNNASLPSQLPATENTSNNLPIHNIDDDNPVETQSAQCTITAGEVRASAQATISKKLEGVCGSKQMSKSFEILETRIMQEIYQIKMALTAINPNYKHQQQHQHHDIYNGVFTPSSAPPVPPLQTQINYHNQQYPHYYQHQYSHTSATNIPKPPIINTVSNLPIHNLNMDVSNVTYQKMVNNSQQQYQIYSPNSSTMSNVQRHPITPGTTTTTTTTIEPVKYAPTERAIQFKPIQTKSLNLGQRLKTKTKQRTMSRDFEVHKFNNTILSGDEIRIFTYYWRIDNYTNKLNGNISEIYSPIFSISGLHLKIKAILNHLNRDYLYLQLESVAYESIEDDSNVILETGNLFQEIETNTDFRHKIVILDQETPTSDLISQELPNTKSGFQVPNSAIVAGPFAKDNNVLIKIVIFL